MYVEVWWSSEWWNAKIVWMRADNDTATIRIVPSTFAYCHEIFEFRCLLIYFVTLTQTTKHNSLLKSSKVNSLVVFKTVPCLYGVSDKSL